MDRPERMARAYAVRRCEELGAPPDEVELVVAELVMNVFQHGQARGRVLVRVARKRNRIWVEILARQAPPTLSSPVGDVLSESGRGGLLLARALTSEFRCEQRDDGWQAFVAEFPPIP